MNVIAAIMATWAPVIMQLTASTTEFESNSFIDGIVQWGGTIGGGILALFLVYAIAKDGIAYAKGGGSIFPIVGKILFLLLCIGLIVIALNWRNLGNKAANLGNVAINQIEVQANEALN